MILVKKDYIQSEMLSFFGTVVGVFRLALFAAFKQLNQRYMHKLIMY